MTIIGIDPGTHRIGYGVITVEKSRVQYVTAGLLPVAVSTSDTTMLSSIRACAESLFQQYSADIIAIEKLFFSKNQKTGITVAQARGALIATASAFCPSIVEFSPNEIKLAVTGSGASDKKAVAKMVGLILHISTTELIDDAVDALAIALCTQQQMKVTNHIS